MVGFEILGYANFYSIILLALISQKASVLPLPLASINLAQISIYLHSLI